MLSQACHIEVAFDHEDGSGTTLFGPDLPILVKAIECLTLVKHRSLRRIEIFGFTLVERSAPETDNPPSRVSYRKHDPTSKSVVLAPLIVPNDEPRFEKVLLPGSVAAQAL